jgi:hypothetical protein
MEDNKDKAINKAETGTTQSNTGSTKPFTPTQKPQMLADEVKVEKEVVKDIPKYPRVVSRIIYIRRRKNGPNIPVEGEFIDESIQKIGSSFSNKSVLRGLTSEEEERWLPKIIGIQSTSDRWEDGTKDYWAHISRPVPPGDKTGGGGLELDISLRYKNHEDFLADERAQSEDGAIINPKGEPTNLPDYILWRYCLKYSRVANNYEDINKSPKIEFYIFSKEKEIKANKAKLDLRRQAAQLMYKNMSDRSWVEHMLRVLIQGDRESQVGIKDIPNMDNDEKDVLLDKYMNSSPALFLNYGTDRHLEMRSFIEVCVVVGLLTRIPNTQSISLDGMTLGNTTDEVVTFLLNPANNSTLSTLKAQSQLRP